MEHTNKSRLLEPFTLSPSVPMLYISINERPVSLGEVYLTLQETISAAIGVLQMVNEINASVGMNAEEPSQILMARLALKYAIDIATGILPDRDINGRKFFIYENSYFAMREDGRPASTTTTIEQRN